ncbi:uncharacterized protein LAESUDRAFT_720526 [Laetiporus sulphureus 93-53]|uniref:Knr4/Smi1-like domain-containing protein n=1 Tax=Laetiporus sulphureus 93-53 TaxID=1314785 RepID=A0A165H6F0_9APHY|nr:uncharacterized protein LAESUDRAFT_720526 [Laetiporus sulphureus 93-53]KZT11306.1 hypothetical protein LAESUDRAFT_720526 [Laetiporus sulphureus 93-53]
MSWLVNLFSSPKNAMNARKSMSSTREAFSLPIASPGFHPHPDAFTAEALATPTSSTSSYSYPPPVGRAAYDYVPAGTRSRQSSLLPLHSSSANPPPPTSYPPLSHTWERLRRWLSKEYPELGDTLNYGILPDDLKAIESSMGLVLPPAVRESYLCVDGQEAESAAGCSEGLFFGLSLLPLEDVLEEWRFWRDVDEDPNTGANLRLREVMQSIPPGWVRHEYSCRGWIPLATDKAGNYLGVDMNPGESGLPGQVIVFGRDFDTTVVLWRGDGPGGWGKWLSSFVDDLESGEGYELGSSHDGSDGSEDSIGYESYFFDGVGGGQGDTGGDAGTGGLRLTGEYRGWNILEAWADRSVRRWQQAGLYSDESYPAWKKGKAPERVSLDRLQIAAPGSGSAAEVPIPVLSEVPEETSALAPAPAPLRNVTNQSRPTSKPVLPTISVTKPPAPLPVELPTPEAIDPLTSDSDFRSPPEGDLEAGAGGRMMREVKPSQPAVPISRPPIVKGAAARPSTTPKRVSSPPSTALTESPNPIDVVAVVQVPDLLSSTEPLERPASTESSHSRDLVTEVKVVVKAEEDSPVLVHAEDIQLPDSPVPFLDGNGDDALQNDIVIIDGPQPPELARIRSNESSVSKEGKKEKRKSASSSRRSLGQLADGQRRDSFSSKGSG